MKNLKTKLPTIPYMGQNRRDEAQSHVGTSLLILRIPARFTAVRSKMVSICIHDILNALIILLSILFSYS